VFSSGGQCNIKARALRAATQAPQFESGPQFNVSVNILNKNNNSMKTLYGFIKWKIPKASCGNHNVRKALLIVKRGSF
jgi:hypothetical protein